MTSVNTNIGALVAQDSMSKASKEMDQAIARLSSGLRINTAADDAAGMSIASKMEAQSRGLEQAIRNSADAQGMIDTTEGAHDEITNVLQRLRELAVQSSNDTNTALDRTFLKAETTALINEIDRISSQTQWNNMNVLDGTFTSKSFQVGANAGQTIAVTVDTAATASIGAFESTGTATLLATAVATSLSLAALPNGILLSICFLNFLFLKNFFTIGVSTKVGHTVLTLMLYSANSTAMPLANPSTPNLFIL